MIKLKNIINLLVISSFPGLAFGVEGTARILAAPETREIYLTIDGDAAKALFDTLATVGLTVDYRTATTLGAPPLQVLEHIGEDLSCFRQFNKEGRPDAYLCRSQLILDGQRFGRTDGFFRQISSQKNLGNAIEMASGVVAAENFNFGGSKEVRVELSPDFSSAVYNLLTQDFSLAALEFKTAVPSFALQIAGLGCIASPTAERYECGFTLHDRTWVQLPSSSDGSRPAVGAIVGTRFPQPPEPEPSIGVRN